ncbi:hypothetical protein ES703_24571 [subsurface metagenome]
MSYMLDGIQAEPDTALRVHPGIKVRENHHLHVAQKSLQGEEGHGQSFLGMVLLRLAYDSAQAQLLQLVGFLGIGEVVIGEFAQVFLEGLQGVAGEIKIGELFLHLEMFLVGPGGNL